MECTLMMMLTVMLPVPAQKDPIAHGMAQYPPTCDRQKMSLKSLTAVQAPTGQREKKVFLVYKIY